MAKFKWRGFNGALGGVAFMGTIATSLLVFGLAAVFLLIPAKHQPGTSGFLVIGGIWAFLTLIPVVCELASYLQNKLEEL